MIRRFRQKVAALISMDGEDKARSEAEEYFQELISVRRMAREIGAARRRGDLTKLAIAIEVLEEIIDAKIYGAEITNSTIHASKLNPKGQGQGCWGWRR